MKKQIAKEDVDYALGISPWDLGNNVLYSLCRDNPGHDRDEVIIAKIWLIGRAYAAAIERRKNAKSTNDDFYKNKVVECVKNSGLDKWLKALPDKVSDPWSELGAIISVHKRLVDRFFTITELKKRSLVSKYLHFHRPDLFFIYDSRSSEAIRQVTPPLKQIPNIEAEVKDVTYHAFCRRSQWLKEDIEERFHKNLTPRQIDNMLLQIVGRTR